jgi:hypothetical protein
MTVLLAPSKDNTLYEVEEELLSNGSGQHFFAGKSASGPVRRAVVAFDLAGEESVGSTITEVTLTLNMSRAVDDGQVIALHRMFADWGKVYRTSGQRRGWSSSNSRWRNLDFRVFDSGPWSEPGGDFVSAPSGDILVIGPG